MLPWIRQQKELSVQLKKYWKLSTEKCPFYTVLWFPSETVKGTLLTIFPFSVGRNRIPCSACILKLNILSFQERGVSLALILWGHMSERHIVLVAQQAPCYSHCWTIRWVIRFSSSWPVLWIVWGCQYISSMVWLRTFAWGRESIFELFFHTLCPKSPVSARFLLPLEELLIPFDKY